MEERLDLNSLG